MGIKLGFFSGANLPKFHDSMLIVKVKPAAAPSMEAAMGPALARRMGVASARTRAASIAAGVSISDVDREVFATPGMNLLERYERGGLIKRVTALARPASAAEAVRGALAVVAMSHGLRRTTARRSPAATAATAATANAGVSMVELERDEDTLKLQKALADDPHIEFVSRVPIRYLLAGKQSAAKARRPGARRAAPPASTMWNLRTILWNEARAARTFKEATGVNVAVLDSGIDRTHPDLNGRVASYTFLHPDTPTISGEKDIIGHGTHVSGTIGAVIGNRRGINGICACRLHSWKIFPDQPDYSPEEDDFEYYVDPVMYQRALADCVEQRMDVVNLSIGGPGEPDPQELALFEQLIANGTTVVAAMGNEREWGSPTSYPAAIPGVIAVGATSLTDRVANFSNRGDHISVCAPGKGIWSTLPTYGGQSGFAAARGPNGKPIEGKPFKRETDYDDWDGTSMASPHVAAAVALLIAKRGQIGPDECRRLLTLGSDAVAGMGGKTFDSDYGYGRLNLERLLK